MYTAWWWALRQAVAVLVALWQFDRRSAYRYVVQTAGTAISGYGRSGAGAMGDVGVDTDGRKPVAERRHCVRFGHGTRGPTYRRGRRTGTTVVPWSRPGWASFMRVSGHFRQAYMNVVVMHA